MNSIGNVDAKELMCMAHGHELKGGNVGGRGCAGWRGVKGGKWDNCNSIIHKLYFFKKETLCFSPSLSLSCSTLPLHSCLSINFPIALLCKSSNLLKCLPYLPNIAFRIKSYSLSQSQNSSKLWTLLSSLTSCQFSPYSISICQIGCST